MEHKILYKTVHGSRLYGLSHENSDYDWYTVVDKVKTSKAKFSTHKVIDETDSVVVDFGTWVDQCTKGVPQALEAMFSSMATVDEIEEFRSSFYVGSGQVYDRYLRTIKSFAYSEKDPFKRKRHALRLALNMKQMRGYGRFNPTLGRVESALVTSLAKLPAEYVYNDALALAWS
jgi:hypothetical protein